MNDVPDHDHDFSGEWPEWANDLVEVIVMAGQFKGLGSWDIRYDLEGDAHHQFHVAPAREPADTFPQLMAANPQLDPDELVWSPIHAVDFDGFIATLEAGSSISMLRANAADEPDQYMIEGRYQDHDIFIVIYTLPFEDYDEDDDEDQEDQADVSPGAMANVPPESDEVTRHVAMLIAMHVRNEMEDFHCKHLSDRQMAELNPIIRNAIYSTLVLIDKSHSGTPAEQEGAKDSLGFMEMLIPSYWEPPQLDEETAWVLTGKPVDEHGRPIMPGQQYDDNDEDADDVDPADADAACGFISMPMDPDRVTWADRTPIGAAEWSICRRCDRPIIHLSSIGSDSGWVHAYAEASWLGSRGCRAATFDHYAEEAWDESIQHTGTASPKRGVRLSPAEIETIKKSPPPRRARRGDPLWQVRKTWADDPLSDEITAGWRAERERHEQTYKSIDAESEDMLRRLDDRWRKDPRGSLREARRNDARRDMLEQHPERKQAYEELLDRLLEHQIDHDAYQVEQQRLGLDAQWSVTFIDPTTSARSDPGAFADHPA